MNERASAHLLDVRDLRTYFYTREGVARAVDGVSFTLDRGQTLGVVGESGSGKSVTLMSLVRLIPRPAGKIVGGQVLLEGRDLLKLSEREMRSVRGAEISVVTQDPMSSLNPVYTIGNQLEEPLMLHQKLHDRRTIRDRIVEALAQVGISDPLRRLKQYPHQFSGGQRQRVVTAMAIECQPKVLLADEPTTALDVTVQIQVLRLLREVQQQIGFGMILVSHDLSVIARVCDQVAVMYAGRIIEQAPAAEIFEQPQHPYTQALMKAAAAARDETGKLYAIDGQPLDVRNLGPGCPFAARCPLVMDVCTAEYPARTEPRPGHTVSCWAVSERPPAGAGVKEATS